MTDGQKYLRMLMSQDIDLILNDSRVIEALTQVTDPLRAPDRAGRLEVLDALSKRPENQAHRPFCCEFDDVPTSEAGCAP